MTNRVTDQTTQNGLISTFKLKGLMPEMSVDRVIIPVVQVANLGATLNVSEFEKWRSVFDDKLPYLDLANITSFTNPLAAGVTKIADTTAMISSVGVLTINGSCGVRLPTGGVGVPATDGVYRLTVRCSTNVTLNISGQITLRDQAAFGDPVTLGTLRATCGVWNLTAIANSQVEIFDSLFAIRASDIANALVVSSLAVGLAGQGQLSIVCTKMIDEIPPSPIFP